MESPMPVSVKKMLADLIEMYRIYGEIIYLFKQKDLQLVYIIQFDELFENRITEPLEETETLRKGLPEHLNQIKYENINFNIQFETDIYMVTADLSEMFVNTFKIEPRIAFFRQYLDSIYTLHKLMRNFHTGLLN